MAAIAAALAMLVGCGEEKVRIYTVDTQVIIRDCVHAGKAKEHLIAVRDYMQGKVSEISKAWEAAPRQRHDAEVNTAAARFNQQMGLEEIGANNLIMEAVREESRAWCKEHGAEYVVPSELMLASPDKYDITKEIMRRVNAREVRFKMPVVNINTEEIKRQIEALGKPQGEPEPAPTEAEPSEGK